MSTVLVPRVDVNSVPTKCSKERKCDDSRKKFSNFSVQHVQKQCPINVSAVNIVDDVPRNEGELCINCGDTLRIIGENGISVHFDSYGALIIEPDI